MAGCNTQSAPTVAPTPTPYVDDNSPSYSGVLLQSEVDELQREDVVFWGRVVNGQVDLEDNDPIIRYRSATRTIFQCDKVSHPGEFIFHRLCVIDAPNPSGRVAIAQAYGGSVSPDEQWIAIPGDIENSLLDCRHQIYIAPLSLETFYPLIDPTIFENDRELCGMYDFEWNIDGAEYTVSFSIMFATLPEDKGSHSISFTDPESPSELAAIPLQ